MRKQLLAAAALTLLASGASAADWSKIRIATEGAYAPWNFTNTSGQLEGFELDLAKDLCARMKAECEVVSQAWDGIIPALQDGRYDAIMAGMSITDDRKKVISFSRSYATTPARFVVLKESPLASFKTDIDRVDMAEISADESKAIDAVVAAMKGKTVGVQTATIHENFLRERLGNDLEVRTYDTQENLDLDVQAGRLDVALADSGYWAPLLASEQGKDMTMVGPGFSGGVFGEGVGVGIRQADTDLLAKFNEAIGAALADGTIKTMTEKWFGFDASATQ